MTVLLGLLLLCARPSSASPLDADLTGVADALYDLQFDSAAAAAAALAAAHPGNPAPRFYQAMVDYQRWAADPEKSTNSLRGFQEKLSAAADAAEAWIATSPAEGYYYLGAARGFSSRVLADQGRLLKAASPGVGSVKYLRRAVALDPALVDAYLGIGMYNYFRWQMPPAIKPFAFLFTGETGDRELGLKQLTLVAEKGGPARTEAMNVLSAIYASDDEKQWDKAIALSLELASKYPHNPLFRLRLSYAAARAGKWADALAADDPDGPWIAGLDARGSPSVRALALYRAAEAALFLGIYDRAQLWLDAAARLNVGEPLEDWVALRRANLYDQQGNRESAVSVYKKLEDPDARLLAKQFLKVPFPGGPRTVKPWTGLESPH